MLTNAYLLAKIGADTAESEQHLPKFCQPTLSDVAASSRGLRWRRPAVASCSRGTPILTDELQVVDGLDGLLSRDSLAAQAGREECADHIVTWVCGYVFF